MIPLSPLFTAAVAASVFDAIHPSNVYRDFCNVFFFPRKFIIIIQDFHSPIPYFYIQSEQIPQLLDHIQCFRLIDRLLKICDIESSLVTSGIVVARLHAYRFQLCKKRRPRKAFFHFHCIIFISFLRKCFLHFQE